VKEDVRELWLLQNIQIYLLHVEHIFMDLNTIKKETTYISSQNVGNVDEDVDGSGNEIGGEGGSSIKNTILKHTIRPMISIAINKIHSGLKGKYDKDIFVYSDPRLLFLDKLGKDFIKENVSGSNINLLNKTVDICLGILKEDVYYRVRGLLLLNMFMEENVRFVLTDKEKELEKEVEKRN
jgi:hypothetical protein